MPTKPARTPPRIPNVAHRVSYLAKRCNKRPAKAAIRKTAIAGYILKSMTTRRFAARPAAVPFSPIGALSPSDTADILFSATPCA